MRLAFLLIAAPTFLTMGAAFGALVIFTFGA